MLIHKARHWLALQVALHLNEHSVYYYQLLYGDKDTFLLGLLLAGTQHTIVPHRPISDTPYSLFQRTMAGDILFQHRTGAKWRYADPQIVLPEVACEADCMAALSVLRAQWNGLVFTPPPRSVRARKAESHIAAAGVFGMRRPGENPGRLKLLAEGEIGAGRAADMMNWHCEERGGAIDLVIDDAFGPAWRLQQALRGWSGRAIGTDREIHLAEENPDLATPHARTHARSLVQDILSAAGFPNPVWMQRHADVTIALRLISAIEPGVANSLASISACCDPIQKRALDGLARKFQPEPRNADIEGIRNKWPRTGHYTLSDLDVR